MAKQPSTSVFTSQLAAFLQERGFLWGPSPELYGGLAGFYEYGPLGKLLKNNVENTLRTVFAKNEYWEVECPTIMPAAVWKASGHLGNFTDPLVTCTKCKASFRADKLYEETFPDKAYERSQLGNLVSTIPCPTCNGALSDRITSHNLMMRTTIGLDAEAYNRPETATTTYLPFQRYFDYFRKKVPFGVFQIGKAYRNEISPRQLTLRMREFTQAESQLFIFEDQKEGYAPYESVKNEQLPFWPAAHQEEEKAVETITVDEAVKRKILGSKAYAHTLALAYKLFTSIGIPTAKMRLRQHRADEKAFYAADAWDLEVELHSFGWTEMCGVHDRTSYDLKQHGKAVKKELGVSDETHKKEVPHILEIAFGPDRMVYAILDLTYDAKGEAEGKTTLRLPPALAPIQVQVFPLVKKEGMPEKARALFESLVGRFTTAYDEAGSIGRRYLRAAMQGTPYCVTVDGETLKDDTVTLRDRDTEAQVRVKLSQLSQTIQELLDGKRTFDKL